MIRKAVEGDVRRVAEIYERIHDLEESGAGSTGWRRGVYPTQATAREALRAGELFVDVREGRVVAAARINREQVPEYALAAWSENPPENEIMVLHTLVVDPDMAGRGVGAGFVAFYEQYAAHNGCAYLRMDTNQRNLRARALYRRLGYREAGVVPCSFNGLGVVGLVCLEKTLEGCGA